MAYKTLPPTLSGRPDYTLVPNHMVDGLERYYWDGIPPGGFMVSVLTNDLSGAIARADTVNRHRLFDLVNFLQWHVRSDCWGSPEAVANWIQSGGLHGQERLAAPGGEDASDKTETGVEST